MPDAVIGIPRIEGMHDEAVRATFRFWIEPFYFFNFMEENFAENGVTEFVNGDADETEKVHSQHWESRLLKGLIGRF